MALKESHGTDKKMRTDKTNDGGGTKVESTKSGNG